MCVFSALVYALPCVHASLCVPAMQTEPWPVRGNFSQSGQYHLLPQSQMEPGWGVGARQTKAAQSPNIIIGLREAIKPSLWRLPLLRPMYKPIAFYFARVIFLSSLVRQHDRWFSLEAAWELILVFITWKTCWYIYVSLLIASACYYLGKQKKEVFFSWTDYRL